MPERLKGVIQYDGTAYRGWQRQSDAMTVQEACERALAGVLGDAVPIVAAGRTDTGVHARGQVAHFDLEASIGPSELRRAWNARLPRDIWVAELTPVASDFHARYDAVKRTYRYFLAEGPRAGSPFVARYHWSLDRPLDWDAVEGATGALLGSHDFAAFAKGAGGDGDGSGRGARCTVVEARWTAGEHGRTLVISADRFLRHMVRALVGALVAVGRHRADADGLARALRDGDRVASGHAPPRGLFLWEVAYDR